jgi:Thiolase, N-terminal domain
VRTPVTRRGGLAGVHPADLGAHVIRALLARTQADPGAVDDVIFGCVDAVGPQAGDIARTAWLAAGLPEAVPGVTVDRQCGSSQQAVHFAAQAVLSGTADLVVAGGVQNMSQVASAGTRPRPSKNPPAAITGMSTAAVTCGISRLVGTTPTCPPPSRPVAITASMPHPATAIPSVPRTCTLIPGLTRVDLAFAWAEPNMVPCNPSTNRFPA